MGAQPRCANRLREEYVDDLNASMKIPKTLTERVVLNPNIDALVKSALNDLSVDDNPVAMTADNAQQLLEAIL